MHEHDEYCGPVMEFVNIPNGIHLDAMHPWTQCAGEFCTVHQPSQHGMNDWPMLLRETLLIERLCSHGVGHPDPDSATAMDKIYSHRPGTWGIHGCDGCCMVAKAYAGVIGT